MKIELDTETKAMLRQLYERWRVSGMSELVRLLIRYAYENPTVIEYYVERESK